VSLFYDGQSRRVEDTSLLKIETQALKKVSRVEDSFRGASIRLEPCWTRANTRVYKRFVAVRGATANAIYNYIVHAARSHEGHTVCKDGRSGCCARSFRITQVYGT